MPLGLARSQKGSENRGRRRNPLPFPGVIGRKGSEKRETKRNPMLLGLARSKKGSENRGRRRNPMPFPGRDKAKRQRKSRKTPKSDAFPWRDKAKRQRKKGNLAKSAAFRAGKKQKKAAKIEETAGIRCLSPASQSQTNKKHQNRLSLQMNYVILNE